MLGHLGVALFEKIRGCGLVGAGVALLEEVCPWVWALRFQELKPGPVTLFRCLPIQLLLLQRLVYLHANMSQHDDNGLNL